MNPLCVLPFILFPRFHKFTVLMFAICTINTCNHGTMIYIQQININKYYIYIICIYIYIYIIYIICIYIYICVYILYIDMLMSQRCRPWSFGWSGAGFLRFQRADRQFPMNRQIRFGFPTGLVLGGCVFFGLGSTIRSAVNYLGFIRNQTLMSRPWECLWAWWRWPQSLVRGSDDGDADAS